MDVPTVGASGAISATLGAFLLSFPRVKVRFFYIWIIFLRKGHFRIAAWLVLGFWFLEQAIYGAATASAGAGVAFFAHIGGFVFGLLVILVIDHLEKGKVGEEQGQPGEAGGVPVTIDQIRAENRSEAIASSRLRLTQPVGDVKMPEKQEKKAKSDEVQEEWKVRFKDGTVFAPVTYDNLLEWYKSGQIAEETPVAKNTLSAKWSTFKETEGYAVAKAQKEGEQIFCTNCGSAWPVGTKFCTECGTNLETGEQISAAGEKKPERALTLRRKTEEGAPKEAVGTAAAGKAVAPPPEAEMAAEAMEQALPQGETRAAVAEAPRSKRGKKGIKILAAAALIVVGVAVLAPDPFSSVLEKIKGVVGKKKSPPSRAEEEQGELAGASADIRSVVEPVQRRIESSLASAPFVEELRQSFALDSAEFLVGAVDELSNPEAFASLATALSEGDLRKAEGILKEERSLLAAEAAETPTPRMDAIQGSVEALLGKKEGLLRLEASLEDADVARLAASFSRGAAEGCLKRLLFAKGMQDPWGSVAEILGKKKEDLGDEFLARSCGRLLAGLPTMAVLIESSSPGAGKRTLGDAANLLESSSAGTNPSVEAALIELGRTKLEEVGSLQKHGPVGVAMALRILSEENGIRTAKADQVIEVLKEGESGDPDNAFFNYSVALVYLQMNRTDEAIAEIAKGDGKPDYRDYLEERFEGMAKVLDSTVPYTAAVMGLSSSHLSAVANCSKGLLESAGSLFRVGRRKEVFDMFGQWDRACDRLMSGVSRLPDALLVINGSVPLLAKEAQLYETDGQKEKAWEARKALSERMRLAMAIRREAAYGPPAVVFVQEVFSEAGYGKESPQEILSGLAANMSKRLEATLATDPASVPAEEANPEDPYYLQAKAALDNRQYVRAFEFALACLARNPRHIWAFGVMDRAVNAATAEAALVGPKAVAYMVSLKTDMSTAGAKRVQYDIEVATEVTKEQAVATARTALQGFLRREKPDGVRIRVMRRGVRQPFVVLDWAPAGEWDNAKTGTPYTEFGEKVEIFE